MTSASTEAKPEQPAPEQVAKKVVKDPYYGHEETSKMAARFVSGASDRA